MERPAFTPSGPAGKFCPRMQQWCDSKKGCVRCPFWTPLYMEAQPGKPEWQWKCSMNWAAELPVYGNQRLEGLQVSMEKLQNRFTEFHRSVLAMVAALSGVRNQLDDKQPPTPLIEAGPEQ